MDTCMKTSSEFLLFDKILHFFLSFINSTDVCQMPTMCYVLLQMLGIYE